MNTLVSLYLYDLFTIDFPSLNFHKGVEKSMNEIYEEMAKSIVELDLDKATNLANKAIKDNMNLLEVIEKGYGEGIRRVGTLWDEGEFFLPELMRGAQVMQEAVDLLTPHLKATEIREKKGTIVMATIEGDIHTIGKTIVSTMLRANGFDVIDLGADVKVPNIIAEAEKANADIIGVSALLTTTMVGQKKVIELLKEKGIRGNYKVILGGAPVTEKWVTEAGADGYAENAVAAVALAKKLLGKS